MLTYNLRAEGYLAEHVGRDEDIAANLTASPADLLILEWMLPGVSGLEICARIRARDTTRNLPIITVSAGGEERGTHRKVSARVRLCAWSAPAGSGTGLNPSVTKL